MRSRIAVVGGFLILVLLLAAYRSYTTSLIFADQVGPTTEFFRTYDPGPVVAHFGKERERSYGEGGGSGKVGEIPHVELMTLLVEVEPSRLGDLSAALRTDIRSKLPHMVSLQVEDHNDATFTTVSPNAWGYVLLSGPVPEPVDQCPTATTWRIKLRMVERCHN